MFNFLFGHKHTVSLTAAGRKISTTGTRVEAKPYASERNYYSTSGSEGAAIKQYVFTHEAGKRVIYECSYQTAVNALRSARWRRYTKISRLRITERKITRKGPARTQHMRFWDVSFRARNVVEGVRYEGEVLLGNGAVVEQIPFVGLRARNYSAKLKREGRQPYTKSSAEKAEFTPVQDEGFIPGPGVETVGELRESGIAVKVPAGAKSITVHPAAMQPVVDATRIKPTFLELRTKNEEAPLFGTETYTYALAGGGYVRPIVKNGVLIEVQGHRSTGTLIGAAEPTRKASVIWRKPTAVAAVKGLVNNAPAEAANRSGYTSHIQRVKFTAEREHVKLNGPTPVFNPAFDA